MCEANLNEDESGHGHHLVLLRQLRLGLGLHLQTKWGVSIQNSYRVKMASFSFPCTHTLSREMGDPHHLEELRSRVLASQFIKDLIQILAGSSPRGPKVKDDHGSFLSSQSLVKCSKTL